MYEDSFPENAFLVMFFSQLSKTSFTKHSNICVDWYTVSKNKPKMAYSRDLPKMARQQCGIID